jgi:hypothetical protein
MTSSDFVNSFLKKLGNEQAICARVNPTNKTFNLIFFKVILEAMGRGR